MKIRTLALALCAIFLFCQTGLCLNRAVPANELFGSAVRALKLGDYATADRDFAQAVSQSPKLKQKVAIEWRNAGLAALKSNLERASALFSKAVAMDERLKPDLGRTLIDSAGALEDETRRAGVVTRASGWAGAEYAFEKSGEYYGAKFGAPRRVYLDQPGWAELFEVKPGDQIYYLAASEFKQRDAGTVRIMPAAVAVPTKLKIDMADTAGLGATPFWLARHFNPTSVYIWLIPKGKDI